MKLVYFASLRERVGTADETVSLPPETQTVDDLISWLSTRGENYAHAFENRRTVRAALDRVHAKHDAPLAGVREVAFFPPMTGGMMLHPTVRVQAAPFDLAVEADALARGRTDIGAIVTFSGLCRDEGGTLAALEIEHYPGMAEAEISAVAEEACRRWPLLGLTAVHRFGRIAPGEPIVLVVTAASHRADAFAAAEFLMDYLKARALLKKEHRRDGTEGAWVEAKASDDAAAERW